MIFWIMKVKLNNGRRLLCVIPPALSVVLGVTAYFVFEYCTDGIKHIDGSDIGWWESMITSLAFGVIGFCVGRLFVVFFEMERIEGGDDYFDYTGGAGGSM